MKSKIGYLLVALGLAKAKKIERKKYDYKNKATLPKGFDPVMDTQPTRRRGRRRRSIFSRLPIGGALSMGFMLLIFAAPDLISLGNITGNSVSPYPDDNVRWEQPAEINAFSETQKRAYWIKTIPEMPCMELKKLIEYYDADGTPATFAKWEYTNNDVFFPSPRQDECYRETGYLRNDVLRDDVYEDEWFIPRNEDSKTINFPSDFFYIDVATNQRYDSGESFVHQYFPALEKDWTING